MVSADADELRFEDYETVACGTQRYRCGGITYRLLRHLCTRRTRASTVKALAAAVWGERVGAEISRVTIKGVIHRANDVLAGLGARERVALDGEAVLLV